MRRWWVWALLVTGSTTWAEEETKRKPYEPCPEVLAPQEAGTGGAGFEEERRQARKSAPSWEKGVSVQAGGGVEGFTGSLAPQIQPGVAYGAQVLIKPSRRVGFELSYSGAVNELDLGLNQDFGATAGADIVRNGGAASINVALSPTKVQPYVHGGIGVSRYTPRNSATQYGFKADTEGNIPLGLGVRTYVGGLVADLRGTYSVLFDEGFAPNVQPRDIVGINSISAGRYAGTLQLGYMF